MSPNLATTDPLPVSRRALLLSLPLLMVACTGKAVSQMPDLPFTELDGQERRLADLRGKVIVLNFWATSCSTCVKEMPRLVETHRRFHAQGLETLAVAMSYDPPAYVMQFAKTRELPFRVTMDLDGSLAKAFGDVELTPTTLVIDRKGQIVKRYIGEPDFAAMDDLLARLLAQPA
jgi:peroxiredoxin